MVIDMGYWSKVGKRLLTLILTIVGIYLAFKLAVFYMKKKRNVKNFIFVFLWKKCKTQIYF